MGGAAGSCDGRVDEEENESDCLPTTEVHGPEPESRRARAREGENSHAAARTELLSGITSVIQPPPRLPPASNLSKVGVWSQLAGGDPPPPPPERLLLHQLLVFISRLSSQSPPVCSIHPSLPPPFPPSLHPSWTWTEPGPAARARTNQPEQTGSSGQGGSRAQRGAGDATGQARAVAGSADEPVPGPPGDPNPSGVCSLGSKPLSASHAGHSLSFLLPNLSFFLTSWSGVSCCSPGPQLTSSFLQHLFLFGSLRAWRRATCC